jgi:tRNA A-37 threonylcarbamoyl transferase component Bud32
MNTPLNAPKQCPNCGKPVLASAPGGICPACLMAQGAETEGAAPRPRFEPPPLETVAALFPKLEIVALLGAGGMGAVYKARQPDLDRFVALKLLPKDGEAEGVSAERFNREARALARLGHPNIVAVHEFGQVEGLHFFIMEFVDGANLRQMELTGRLSAREALQIIPQICDALQYAHDAGVVHRDIKPENVLVDRKGRVKIADFGLAKIVGTGGESTRLTVDGQVMGTPHYMAPEQVERPLAVDHRADIYSLGVVFYEMLTGDLPIGKFAPPSRKVQLDVRLDEIVLRALENDPERRYQQASEVKTRVENVTETEGAASRPGEEPPSPTGEKYLRWAGIPVVVERNGEREVSFNGALGLVATVLAVVAVGMFAILWTTGRDHFSLRLCLFIAGWTVFFAIRSTLRRKDPTPVKAANGTVVLPPARRHPYLWHHATLAVVLALVVGSHWLKVGVIEPMWAKSAQPFPDLRAAMDPATGIAAVSHPTGGRVELLGVADIDSASNGWWRADGQPMANRTFSVRERGGNVSAEGQLKDVVLRFSGLESDAVNSVQFVDSLGSSSISGADEVFQDGEALAGDVRHYRVAFPFDKKSTSIRVAWGVGLWRSVTVLAAPNWNQTSNRRAKDPLWNVRFLQGVVDTVKGAQVSYLFNASDDHWADRVVLVDTNGVEHTAHTGSGSGFDKTTGWSLTFPGVMAGAVKEVLFQVRPLQHLVFPTVALEPKTPLAKRPPLRFGEIMERTFDELIDFDTGTTASFPAAGPGSNPMAGIGENVLWAQKNGYDACAGTDGLEILNAEFGVVADEDWERLTPQQVIESVSRGRFAPKVLKPLKADGSGRTYSYETRKHGFGLVQLQPSAQAGRATIRLKQVIR